ncbi:MAG: mechanosensitive ion channel [Pedobacter sp.]|nr:MAG: mechanosensitive ion channel [Pedobacter sp.]
MPDTLLFKIQKAQSAITEVNAANKKGYNIEYLKNSLRNIQEDISPLQRDFKDSKNTIETKSLLSYSLILKDASDRLTTLRNTLVKNNTELQRMSQSIIDLSADSVLAITANDKTEKKLYQDQLQEIKQRLQAAGKLTGTNLDQVSRLLAEVSALDIVVNDLRSQTDDQIQRSGKMAVGREAPFLWNAPFNDMPNGGIFGQITSSYLGQQQILSYFINSTWDKRILALLFAGAFFFWVHKNSKLSRRPAIRRKIGVLKFEYLKAFPILASFIVLFNITPLFEPDAPSLYIELIQFLLLLAMTYHLRLVLQAQQLKYWLIIIGLYAMLIIGNGITSTAFPMRICLLAINAFFLYLGLRLYKNLKITQFTRKYVRIVIGVLISFNGIAILLNLFGRLSLAKAFAMTGVIGLTQMIGLAVFMQIMLDAMELQIKISSCNKGIFSRVNHNTTRASIRKALHIFSILLWLMVFMINMSMLSGALSLLEGFLTKQRSFGSIHFTLGNVVFFTVIVYIANKLQKHVPILFGEGSLTYDGEVEHKSSKVALIRLVIIILGVLFAVTASGLPMDRLTVILGALGVGIGLGMQNIVNNFVSGIILIFEKPFRIGDYVELADKKGKVKDIGIRSSKLITPQGSEVIIPNGDLLSGRLVNWTLSHDYVKSELIFKVGSEADLDILTKMIDEEVKQTTHVMDGLPVEILLNSFAAGSIELKVMAWVQNIYVEPSFKSELLVRLMKRLKEMEIAIV